MKTDELKKLKNRLRILENAIELWDIARHNQMGQAALADPENAKYNKSFLNELYNVEAKLARLAEETRRSKY